MINLTHSCLLTDDVEKMRQFYMELLGFKPQVDNQGYWFRDPDGNLLNFYHKGKAK